MKRRKAWWALPAVAIASIAALMLPTATASAATGATNTTGSASPAAVGGLAPSGHAADGTPVYHVTSRVAEPLDSAHACAVLGPNDGVNQGVVCADVIAVNNGNGTVSLTPQVEGMCQSLTNSSDFPQCANITIAYGLWSAQAGKLYGDFVGECGHAYGPCYTPRTYFYPSAYVTSGCYEVWTVAYGGAVIELPGSGTDAYLQANLGSGHVTVCP